MGANAIWIVVPSLVILYCFRHINAAVEASGWVDCVCHALCWHVSRRPCTGKDGSEQAGSETRLVEHAGEEGCLPLCTVACGKVRCTY